MNVVRKITNIVESGPMTFDELFDVFANERRRIALYCLDARRREVGLAELADAVARVERGIDDGKSAHFSDEDVQSVYLDLYHNHVPKMEDYGIVEFDPASGIVRLHSVLTGFHFEAVLSDDLG
jgi:hypothetical protein